MKLQNSIVIFLAMAMFISVSVCAASSDQAAIDTLQKQIQTTQSQCTKAVADQQAQTQKAISDLQSNVQSQINHLTNEMQKMQTQLNNEIKQVQAEMAGAKTASAKK